MLRDTTIDTIVCWRSDTRPPEEIWPNGFLPKTTPTLQTKWWQEEDLILRRRGTIDANQLKCICLSTYLNSTALFPISKKTDSELYEEGAKLPDFPQQLSSADSSYVYAIALPSALKIDIFRGEQHPTNGNIPSDLNKAVIDLHSLQVEYTNYVIQKYYKDQNMPYSYNDMLCIGGTLKAYEAIASSVSSDNIVCAVKIERSRQFMVRMVNSDGQEFFEHMRYYKISPNIIMNEHFKPKQTVLVKDQKNNEIRVTVDYSNCKNEILKTLARESNKLLLTPVMSYGFGGKIFAPSLKNPTFFNSPQKAITTNDSENENKQQDNLYKPPQAKSSRN